VSYHLDAFLIGRVHNWPEFVEDTFLPAFMV